MASILDKSEVDLLSDHGFKRKMHGIVLSLEKQRCILDDAVRDFTQAVENGCAFIETLNKHSTGTNKPGVKQRLLPPVSLTIFKNKFAGRPSIDR